jgi:single-strand DNA-binding protein
MPNINLVQICGRLTKKPEIKTTASGLQISNFSVATNRVWRDQQGQKQEEVEFHNVVAFSGTAETINKYFDKGDEIYIIGRLKTSSWEAQDGSKRYKTEIVADRFEFGQKSKQNANSGQSDDYSQPEPHPELAVKDDSDGEITAEDLPW